MNVCMLYTNPSVSRSAVQIVVPALICVFGPVLADIENMSGNENNERLLKLNTALKDMFSQFYSEHLRFREFSSYHHMK